MDIDSGHSLFVGVGVILLLLGYLD